MADPSQLVYDFWNQSSNSSTASPTDMVDHQHPPMTLNQKQRFHLLECSLASTVLASFALLKLLEGHQNAHKRERAASRGNMFSTTTTTTDSSDRNNKNSNMVRLHFLQNNNDMEPPSLIMPQQNGKNSFLGRIPLTGVGLLHQLKLRKEWKDRKLGELMEMKCVRNNRSAIEVEYD